MIIEPNNDRSGVVLNCAVRYALGRAPYVQVLVMDEIRPMIPNLTKRTLWCMKEDISSWLEDITSRQSEVKPWQQPYEEWEDFLSAIQEQLNSLETREHIG